MAKFIRGQSGNQNGRPYGRKNKKTAGFRQQLATTLAEHDFCPIAKLIDLAKHHPDRYIQLAATKHLSPSNFWWYCCNVCGLWFMVYGLWFMVYGLWFMVYGFISKRSANTKSLTRPTTTISTMRFK